MHCPFGYTLKKCGLQFQDVSEKDFSAVEALLLEAGAKEIDWRAYLPENIKFVVIKEQVCGLILKNHIVIKHLVLKPHFQNQDLSKEMVESYYFI